MSKTKPFGGDRCPNCGEYGAHFVPPSFGDEGFFICEKKTEPNCLLKKDCKYYKKWGKCYPDCLDYQSEKTKHGMQW